MTKLTLFKVLVTRSTQNNKENGERITKQPKIKSGVEKDEERVRFFIVFNIPFALVVMLFQCNSLFMRILLGISSTTSDCHAK